jgi:hypothetical protein
MGTFVILFNLNTHEEFRYDVPTREAQALVDMMVCLRYPGLDWVVKESSADILVPRCVDMSQGAGK